MCGRNVATQIHWFSREIKGIGPIFEIETSKMPEYTSGRENTDQAPEIMYNTTAEVNLKYLI